MKVHVTFPKLYLTGYFIALIIGLVFLFVILGLDFLERVKEDLMQ